LKYYKPPRAKIKGFTFGNGGSGSTASQFRWRFIKSCGYTSVCLNDSLPSLTAWANDSDVSGGL